MGTKLILVERGRRNKIKFSFFQLAIFQILLEDFGYSYIKISGRGKFLKSVPGGFKIVGFQQLRDSFTDYLRHDFDRTTIPTEISYEDFMNTYYQSNPITRTYARSFFRAEKKLNEKDYIVEGEYLKFK